MPDLDHLRLLEDEVAATTAALAASDADAAVASCPGWTVRDLARHVITLHRWVREALDSASMPPYEEQPVDGNATALARVYADSGDAMVARLRELPADHPCWTFDPDNQTASFWHRRQAHELSVHLWDLSPYSISEPLAADGIDEALDFFFPRMLKAGRATPPVGSLVLASPERTWTVGDGEPVSRVEAPTSELLLSLWGRGDLLPAAWRDAHLVP